MSLDLRGRPSAGSILHRIRSESRDESEKGRWFERLCTKIRLDPKLKHALDYYAKIEADHPA